MSGSDDAGEFVSIDQNNKEQQHEGEGGANRLSQTGNHNEKGKRNAKQNVPHEGNQGTVV